MPAGSPCTCTPACMRVKLARLWVSCSGRTNSGSGAVSAHAMHTFLHLLYLFYYETYTGMNGFCWERL